MQPVKGYRKVRNLFVPMWTRAFRFDIDGEIPDGPAVLVANHASVVDHFIVAAATPRYMANMAHKEAFDHPIGGRFLRWIGALPIARTGGDEPAVEAAVQALRDGHLVCLYPEGDWSPDGRIHRFHTGAVRIAAAAGVPIIPMGIRGSLERRKGTWFRMGGPVTLHIGDPVEAGEPRATSDALQAEVARLAQLETVDQYVQELA